jgi:hypothetical protein
MSLTAQAEVRSSSSTAPVHRGRRAPRHVLVGMGLMAVFALMFAVVALRTDPATPVLAVAQPLAAGQTITEADLEVVRVVPDAGIDLIAESEKSTVVGRTASVPLVAGGLLSPAQVGAAAWPPPGESVIAVPVAAGRLPSGLSTGSRVSVLTPPDGATQVTGQTQTTTTTTAAAVTATVVAVEPPTAAGVSSVSLLLDATQARQVAAAGGEIVLVLESPQSTGTGR